MITPPGRSSTSRPTCLSEPPFVDFIDSAMSAQSGLQYATRRTETSSQSVERKRGIRARSCQMTTLRSTARGMDAWRNTWKNSRICVRVKVDDR